MKPFRSLLHGAFACMVVTSIVHADGIKADTLDKTRPFEPVELSIGLGFPYFGLAGFTVLPVHNVYMQVQAASIIFLNEEAVVIGCQFDNPQARQWKFRLGIGYCQGSDGIFMVTDSWQGIMYQGAVLHYFNKHFALSFNCQLEQITRASLSPPGASMSSIIPDAYVGMVFGL